MSTSSNELSTEKPVVTNDKSCIGEETAIESECEPQCTHTDTKNAQPEAAQTESVSDWLVMVCVLLCNILNGINLASYGVLYLPITEMFRSSRAAVGWIVSFDLALASFLGELH